MNVPLDGVSGCPTRRTDPRLVRLYLRGRSAGQISRTLRRSNEAVLKELLNLLNAWTDEYGSPEVGACASTFHAIEEFCRDYSVRPALSASERSRFEGLALRASEKRVHVCDLFPRRRNPESVSDAVTLRRTLKAFAALLREQETGAQAAAVEPANDIYDDTRRKIERLVIQGVPTRAIGRQLALTSPAIDHQIDKIHLWWSHTFGSSEVGEAFSRARRQTERSLDEVMAGGRSAIDCARSISLALASCCSCANLLRRVSKPMEAKVSSADHLDRARQLDASLQSEYRVKLVELF
jgi:hypothetical protein